MSAPAPSSLVGDDGLSASELAAIDVEEARVNDENQRALLEKQQRDEEEVQQSLRDLNGMDDTQRTSHTEKKHSELDTFLASSMKMADFVRTQVATAQSGLKVVVADEDGGASAKGKKRGGSKAEGGGKKKRKGKSGEADGKAADGEMLEVRQPKSITGGVLRDYQLAGVAWLLSVDMNGFNGILADEMGLGKTIQLIAFYAALREQGVKGPLLVVAPLSTVPNWVREFKKWWPSQPVCMYHGGKEKRQAMRARGGPMDPERQNLDDFPVVVTTYEIIIKDSAVLGRGRYRWKYLSVDEGHRLKNSECLLIQKLAEYNSDRRVLLTGTPLQNNLRELWSLLNFLMQDQFMDSETFLRHFELDDLVDDEQALVRAQKRNDVLTKLHSVLRPYVLRRLKGDVDIGIPPKREAVIYCPMTVMQRELYQFAIDGTLAKTVKERQGVGMVDVRASGSLQNKLMQLRKICNHPFLIEDHTPNGTTNENIVRFSGKMQVLDKMLREFKAKGHKVLIFSQWTRTLDILEDYMRTLRGWETRVLTGSTNVMERMQFMDEFNGDPDIFAFLLSTRAGGLGINLVSADTVIIFDSDWNPFADMQAMDRCHRIGQKKPVAVYRLISENTAENLVLRAACHKRKLELTVITRGNYQVNFKDSNANPADADAAVGDSELTPETRGPTESQVKNMLAPLIDMRTGDTGGISDAELHDICDREQLMAAGDADDGADGGAGAAKAVPLVGVGYQILKAMKGTAIGSTHKLC